MDITQLRDDFLCQLTSEALKGISIQAINGEVSRKQLEDIGKDLLESQDDVVVICGSYHGGNASFLSDADLYCIRDTEPEAELKRQLRVIHGVPCEINVMGTAFLDKFLTVTGSMRSGRTTPSLANCGYLAGNVQLHTSISLKARNIMESSSFRAEIEKLRETYQYGLTSLLMDLVSDKGVMTGRMIVLQIAATLSGLFSLQCLGWNHCPQYLARLSLQHEDVRILLSELNTVTDHYQSTGSWASVYELALRHLNALGGARWAGYGDATRIL